MSSDAPSVESSDIDALASSIVTDIQNGDSVTIGVECPLFLPCPDVSKFLGTARDGECSIETGNKPFTASSGACAMVTGIQGIAWVLREIHRQCNQVKATTRWDAFRERPSLRDSPSCCSAAPICSRNSARSTSFARRSASSKASPTSTALCAL
ncbi:MAG: hypothetical protein JWM57_3770, partial [Phycisphaerales bacterium]|nr:hypothetical protein [Phycisphaerales bacterium]